MNRDTRTRAPGAEPVAQSRTESGAPEGDAAADDAYVLEEQIGFILRQVSQRHATIFAEHMVDGLTPTQFSALCRLRDAGPCSQNRLGRLTAMDAATIKGVVDRLSKRGLVVSGPDATDGRRLLVDLSPQGRKLIDQAVPRAREITTRTLDPLNAANRAVLLRLLKQLR
ncbi:MAG: MarR family transcriptional regulator [Rhodobacterales bacterium]|nr:MarR family transcriptional regulator [Rhodobacterales bacterium]